MLRKQDGLWQDAMETAALSQQKPLVEELLRFFVENIKKDALMAGKSKDEVKGSQKKGKAMDLQCVILFICVCMSFHVQTRENALIVQSILRENGMRLSRDAKSSFVAIHGRRGDRKSPQLPRGGSTNTW